MLKLTRSYEDFNGVSRTEDFYFNLTQAELYKMYSAVAGGWDKQISKLLSAQDGPAIMATLDRFIDASYGEKSEDGRRFMKSEEILRRFKETEAYSAFYMELLGSDEAGRLNSIHQQLQFGEGEIPA